MNKDKKNIDFKQSLIGSVPGIVLSLLFSFFTILLAAFLIHNEKLNLESMSTIALLVHFVSMFIGMLLKAILTKSVTLIESAIVAIVYSFFFVGFAIVFFDGLNLDTLWNLLASISGVTSAVLLYYSLE